MAAASVALAVMPAVAEPTPPARVLGPVIETVVKGACQGGGGVVLRVEKEPDAYTMTATAHGLPEGTRWRLALSESSNANHFALEAGEARPVVRDGGWSVRRSVPALRAPYFYARRFRPGQDRPH